MLATSAWLLLGDLDAVSLAHVSTTNRQRDHLDELVPSSTSSVGEPIGMAGWVH